MSNGLVNGINPAAIGRTLGVYKGAAKKAGCSLQEWLAHRVAGRRWCYRCRSWKPTQHFAIDGRRPGGRAAICRPCVSVASTASRYKLTRAELKSLKEAHGGVCPICARAATLVVDHNHSDGRFRGFLCYRCNVGLGQFLDSPELLRAAMEYLEGRCGDEN